MLMQCYAQVLTFAPAYISQANLSHPFRVLSKFALNCTQLKLLVIGHLFRHDGVYYYLDKNIKDKQQFFAKAIEAIQAQIKHHAIFLKDLPAALSMPFKMNTKFQAFDNDVSMQLTIPATWNSIADYENALTKKYAKRMRTTQKQMTDVSIQPLSLLEVEKHQQRIYELYHQVAKNQTITFGLLNEKYFGLFKKQMGDALKMYGYFYQGNLIAFSSAIIHDGAYDMNYIGFDYTYNQQLGLYFNMLFCCVQNAIDEGCNTLILGRTALEAKAILGCHPVPIKGYYKINNFVFREITKRFTSRTATAQGEMWMNRHPFKEV
jgi:Acetyltransferase (GNAT) domain